MNGSLIQSSKHLLFTIVVTTSMSIIKKITMSIICFGLFSLPFIHFFLGLVMNTTKYSLNVYNF